MKILNKTAQQKNKPNLALDFKFIAAFLFGYFCLGRNRLKPRRLGCDISCLRSLQLLISISYRMINEAAIVVVIGVVAWAYRATRPPPPKICGSPGGPPITAPRIKVRDGRHLAYKEHGVPKEVAKHKIVFAHGMGSSRHFAFCQEVLQELEVYLVTFDRAGYAESDPDPKRTLKSMALDVEQLADQLGLGPKFYFVGFSLGGMVGWGCLKYIPHRLQGVALLAPAINYWWPGFPTHLSEQVYSQLLPQDQWALRIAHHTPWLTYWWNSQKLFPPFSTLAQDPRVFSRQDKELIYAAGGRRLHQEQISQQGEFESLHRDLMIGFGSWEFDPMELDNPLPDNEASVHLWQGDEDRLVPVILQRYIASRNPWIHYHEIPGAGHLFPMDDKMSKPILEALLLADK